MKKILLLLIVSMSVYLLSFNAKAAVNAQYGFEDGIPHFVKVNGNGEAVSSGDKFKDGSKSFRFSW